MTHYPGVQKLLAKGVNFLSWEMSGFSMPLVAAGQKVL